MLDPKDDLRHYLQIARDVMVWKLVDGAAGHRVGNDNMADGDQDWWAGYRDRLEQAAKDAAGPG